MGQNQPTSGNFMLLQGVGNLEPHRSPTVVRWAVEAARRGQQRALGPEGTHTSWEDDASSLIGSTPPGPQDEVRIRAGNQDRHAGILVQRLASCVTSDKADNLSRLHFLVSQRRLKVCRLL